MNKFFIGLVCTLAMVAGWNFSGTYRTNTSSEETAVETPSETHREIVAFRDNDLIRMLMDYCYHHPQENIQGMACGKLDLKDFIHPFQPMTTPRKGK